MHGRCARVDLRLASPFHIGCETVVRGTVKGSDRGSPGDSSDGELVGRMYMEELFNPRDCRSVGRWPGSCPSPG